MVNGQQEVFSKMNTTLDMAANTNSNLLSAFVILSAVFTEFCLADLICAEADKVDYALDTSPSTDDLVALDNSIANVLQHVCCIEKQINEKIAQGIELRNC